MISEKLLQLMAEKKVTKSELAKLLGVTRASVTKALASNHNWTIDSVIKYLDVLGYEPEMRFVRKK